MPRGLLAVGQTNWRQLHPDAVVLHSPRLWLLHAEADVRPISAPAPNDTQHCLRPLPRGSSGRGSPRRQGREKAYVLTGAGAAYSARHLALLNAVGERAAQIFGQDRIRAVADLVMEYDSAPETALEELVP